MPDSLYGARLQGFTVVVFIVAKSRAWFDEYIYHDSLQARAIEGIGHYERKVRVELSFGTSRAHVRQQYTTTTAE